MQDISPHQHSIKSAELPQPHSPFPALPGRATQPLEKVKASNFPNLNSPRAALASAPSPSSLVLMKLVMML